MSKQTIFGILLILLVFTLVACQPEAPIVTEVPAAAEVPIETEVSRLSDRLEILDAIAGAVNVIYDTLGVIKNWETVPEEGLGIATRNYLGPRSTYQLTVEEGGIVRITHVITNGSTTFSPQREPFYTPVPLLYGAEDVENAFDSGILLVKELADGSIQVERSITSMTDEQLELISEKFKELNKLREDLKEVDNY